MIEVTTVQVGPSEVPWQLKGLGKINPAFWLTLGIRTPPLLGHRFSIDRNPYSHNHPPTLPGRFLSRRWAGPWILVSRTSDE